MATRRWQCVAIGNCVKQWDPGGKAMWSSEKDMHLHQCRDLHPNLCRDACPLCLGCWSNH
eukprot:10521541-Karenia_brevis.AAC.1